MPRKEEKRSKLKETTVTEAVKGTTPWPLITAGLVVSVVMLAVLAGVWLMVATRHDTDRDAAEVGGRDQMEPGMRAFSHREMREDRLTAAARGVVTSVDGNSFTVSGDGKKMTVKRDSNMIVTGDKTDIAVNDSVIIFGTTASDGAVTATRVLVNNQQE